MLTLCLNILLGLLAFSLLLIILVGVHEYAHLLAAKLFKVKILKFSIGFGKPILKRQGKDGAWYMISRIPIGGYVKMLDEREGTVAKEDLPYAFNRQAIWQRAIILVAGSLSNLLLAAVVFWVMLVIGIPTWKPIIDEIKLPSIAATAGLKAGDQIMKVDGELMSAWPNVMLALLLRVGDKDSLLIETQQDSVQSHQLPLAHWRIDPHKPNLLSSLGIVVHKKTTRKPYDRHYAWYAAIRPALKSTWNYIYLDAVILIKVIQGKISWGMLSGPLSLLEISYRSLQHSILAFLSVLATLSIATGFVNLLPIPGLDGGHLFYLLIDKFRGAPLSTAVASLIISFGDHCFFLVSITVDLE